MVGRATSWVVEYTPVQVLLTVLQHQEDQLPCCCSRSLPPPGLH
jgi:hypothetical protein